MNKSRRFAVEYIKKASATAESKSEGVRDSVKKILMDIEQGGESAVRELARKFDKWEGDFILSEEKKSRLISSVPESVKDDIRFAHAQVQAFARAQRDSIQEFEIENFPGVTLGQRIIPMDVAGCYVPGGRFAHACSALMSVATAKTAGVPFVVAASPPRGEAIDPAVAFAMDYAGADVILELGGIQAIASMALGLFTGRPANILVGPGNAYVAEAKAYLAGTGRCCIDVFAGPTESAVIADATADPMTVAIDLVSQAEHGYDSPVWLYTDSRELALNVMKLMDQLIDDMPNPDVPRSAWRDHVQVIAEDLDWWRLNLKSYGSLFLGEGSTVPHGDKCSGTNHILPTKKAGYYSGGLNVHKFLKIYTFQQISQDANKTISAVASRLSRVEGMEGHARACDWRLKKYFPGESWDFHVYNHPDYKY
jgi:sulfopropanediol 3-dehydrogenase